MHRPRPCHVVVLTALICSGPGSALAASRSLQQARAALESFELEKVLPLLKKALRETNDGEELIEIYLLTADMHVTYDHHGKAVSAFVEVLKRDPAYEPEPGSSPKITAAWQEAKAKLAPPPKKAEPPPPKKAEPPPPKKAEPAEPVAEKPEAMRTVAPSGPADDDRSPDESQATEEVAARSRDKPPDYLLKQPDDPHALYKQWWLWAGVGVVVVVAGIVIAVVATPKLPPYQYGPVALSPP